MAHRAFDDATDGQPDLVADATRICSHARLALDLLVKQITIPQFKPATDAQIAQTATIVDSFIEAVVRRYLVRVEQAGVRAAIDVAEATPSISDPELVAAALARTDEHWITQALRAQANGSLHPLAPAGDGEEAELAFVLLGALNRRVDIYGEPVMIEEDVDYKTLERLVWRVAAEVRAVLTPRCEDLDELDRALTDSARHYLGPYRRRQPSPADRVAEQLLNGEADLPELLSAALSRAQPRLFCALIAARLKLPGAAVLPALTQPERLALLLAAAGLSDQEATGILLQLSEPLMLADDRLITIAEGYRALEDQATLAMLRQMRLHPHYRAAIFERERRKRASA